MWWLAPQCEDKRPAQWTITPLCVQGRGLTREDVARSATKLRLYRRLRQLDPSGFWLLCRADTTRTFETQVGPALLCCAALCSA